MRKQVEYRSNGLINVPIVEIHHRGYTIQQKLDMGSTPWQSNGNIYRKGYIVVKNGALAMPGGAWFSSVIEAMASIDIFIKANGDAQKFWSLLREQQSLSEYHEV